MDFDYEVTLSPENNKKWNEMVNDPTTRKLMIEMYQLIVTNDREGVNAIIEKSYASFKEGMLPKHFESFKKLYEAGQFLEDYKF